MMLVAMFMFVANDTLGKWLVATYSVGQIMVLRSVGALLVMTPLLLGRPKRELFRTDRPVILTLRVVFAAFESSAFYYATITLPLSDVITYWLAAPIYVAALSPFMLGERVGWRRWTAIAVGFVGVAIALRPSSAALTPAALVSLVGSFVFSLTVIFGRQLRGTPDTALVFWQLVAALILGLVSLPFFGWTPPDLTDYGLLGLIGVVSTIAHACVNRSLKLGEAATVAPMQYTTLIWGVLFGWIIFRELPDAAVVVGAAIIIGSGLFIAFRQRKTGSGEPTVVDAPQ
ncbi:DMT family transporter [Aureimonas leprariae]|uniref:DMT family transporter n=2 Tax=Plantimonas leprariae TaxID=2615207 RepID=A0A7V7PK96_9HYPH|nr:DMT family transporter [Aureimonas leprariae]